MGGLDQWVAQHIADNEVELGAQRVAERDADLLRSLRLRPCRTRCHDYHYLASVTHFMRSRGAFSSIMRIIRSLAAALRSDRVATLTV